MSKYTALEAAYVLPHRIPEAFRIIHNGDGRILKVYDPAPDVGVPDCVVIWERDCVNPLYEGSVLAKLCSERIK